MRPSGFSTGCWLFSSLFIALAGCSGSSNPGSSTNAKPTRHNVLLVTLDTTRRDHFGCYGDARGLTPNFDTLAAEGVRFDLAIVTAAATPVSHASILSGLYQFKHGLRVIYAATARSLPPAVPTLATVLKQAGWSTGAFLSSFTVSEEFGLQRGFEHWDNGLSVPADSIFHPTADGARFMWEVESCQRRSDQTTDKTLEWIKATSAPFLAWIHYWDPHDDGIMPPSEILDRFKLQTLDGDARKLALYQAEVAYVDQQFGRLVKGLQAAGKYDDTLIVVISDHGEGLGDHNWWSHRLTYQEQIHVPLIIRIPGGPKGRVVPELVRAVDLYPTIFQCLGVPLPSPVDGKPLQPLMDRKPDGPRMAYADQLNLFDLNASVVVKRPLDDLLYVAMDQSWKLIYRRRHAEQSELYNIATDPRELKNVFNEYPAEVARLRKFLDSLGCYRDEPFGVGATDSEAIRRLKSLGYAGDDDDATSTTQPASKPVP